MSTIFERVPLQKDLWEQDLARVYKESLDLITVKMAPAYLAMPSIPIEELDDPSVPEVYKNAVRIFLNTPTIVATGILFSYIYTSRPVIFSEWSWDSETTKQMDIPFISVKPSAEEIFDGFKMVCPLAVPIIIDQLDCPLQQRQLLKRAYCDNQRDSFINGINNLTCDISVLNYFSTFLAFNRWLFIMMFTNPQAISDVVYHSDQFNLSKIIKDTFISEEELEELDRINKELESLRGKPHTSENESGGGESVSPEQEEEARVNAEQMVSGAKQILVGVYDIFKQLEEQFFPFEKKYYYDLLELPGVQPLIDDIAEAYSNDNSQGAQTGPQEPEGEGKPEEKQREYSKDGLRWLTDEAFSGYDPVGNEKAYFQASMIGTSTALRMSTIYKLFLFLTSQGKLGKSQEVLDLLAFRLTGKDPYGIDKTRKLAWKGSKSDYSLCYFLWKMFSKELEDGKTYQYDSRFWKKAEDFFVYANGKSVVAGDEQSNRQQFTEKTGKDAEDPFAIALRGELTTLHKEQAELEREK